MWGAKPQTVAVLGGDVAMHVILSQANQFQVQSVIFTQGLPSQTLIFLQRQCYFLCLKVTQKIAGGKFPIAKHLFILCEPCDLIPA